MKVVIYGLRGVGVETAKNLTLQGVGSLTLVDANVIDIKDVGVNFFFHKEDVGQSRVSVMLPRLQELTLYASWKFPEVSMKRPCKAPLHW